MKLPVVASIAATLVLAASSPFAAAQKAPQDPDKVAALLNEAPPQTTTLDGVVLSTQGEGDRRLQGSPGSFSTTYAFVTMLMFMNYPDLHSSVRTKDTRPTLHLKMGANPKGRVYLVKVESNPKTNDRSLKLGHSGFGSVGGMTAPDTKWTMACTITQESPGIWKLVPDAALAPGEYGLFSPNVAAGAQVAASGDLYDFGVDG